MGISAQLFKSLQTCRSAIVQKSDADVQVWQKYANLSTFQPLVDATVSKLGILQPLSILRIAPSIYGYHGCSCMAGYHGHVSFDAIGMRP